MSDKNTPVVAFVGLGSMGLGMAKNLLKAGHKVIGVDPSAAAREAFLAAGGVAAASPAEAAASADAVVVAVVNAQQIETVLFGEANHLYLLDVLDRLGYQGHVGLEYKPKTTTGAGLGWAAKYGIKA